jgi:hypothetical protein
MLIFGRVLHLYHWVLVFIDVLNLTKIVPLKMVKNEKYVLNNT